LTHGPQSIARCTDAGDFDFTVAAFAFVASGETAVARCIKPDAVQVTGFRG
jgi:hypothetical protein